ncbi:precorrin-6Y C5,15-methyltransferase (decarboxylating) [Nocardia tenerifensis]|uniref:Precorrin-6Y C5,15-methyltransferase (Decarboxylating) n=1 Tax=Nocardia tenerifensis TaxID=228006 RepID=A0A318JX43_9NOCA|nr:bifunctional cobalt-precorrin-7 (C(5))-methyltransferase/cobalt-precorrin-6B (C(15))-methyltransferase [Nocardia tenerifensis]PXX59311.1 precorrin-6Y C5,15-methyltransferase (decarboxylating) [Nocardia tenerifensis]
MAVLWSGPQVVVVGIGADGWEGLGRAAREAVAGAEVLFGSVRQLGLVPEGDSVGERVGWPSPLVPALPGLFERYAGARVCVLGSGDPMFYGIGVTLARLLGSESLRVLPQPSSTSLACARLGWGVAATPVVSVVGRPLATVLPELAQGRRVLVLSADERTPAQIAELLGRNGFGDSTLTVLEQLGGPAERVVAGIAKQWGHPAGDPLNVVAIECAEDPGHTRASRLPGLPDELFTGDGQLTKNEVRALTVAALAPAPGELLWDVGGGSGSIAIEWCRTHPACRAVTFERLESRRKQITDNASALGVPHISVRGEVSAELRQSEFPSPDAIFIGGGLTQHGLFETCWSQLRQGGRLVANAVTAESESQLLTWAAEHGGTLRKFQIYRAEPLGSFTTWRPQLPVTQWSVVKMHKVGPRNAVRE